MTSHLSIPFRKKDAVVRSKRQLMPDYWCYLREEARKSWNYLVTDGLVYLDEMFESDSKSFLTFPEDDFRSARWIELNVRFVGQSEMYLRMVIEILLADRFGGRCDEIVLGESRMHRDMAMFVDIPKPIENVQVMNFVQVPALVWLNGTNKRDSLFGDAVGIADECPLNVDTVVLKNRESQPLGNRFLGIGCSVHMPHQVVQRGAEAGDEISSDQREAEVYFGWTNLNNILSSLKIVIGGNRLTMEFAPRFYELTQVIEVHFRPVDFVHYSANW